MADKKTLTFAIMDGPEVLVEDVVSPDLDALGAKPAEEPRVQIRSYHLSRRPDALGDQARHRSVAGSHIERSIRQRRSSPRSKRAALPEPRRSPTMAPYATTDLSSIVDLGEFIAWDYALLTGVSAGQLFLESAAFVVLLMLLAVALSEIEPRPRPRAGRGNSCRGLRSERLEARPYGVGVLDLEELPADEPALTEQREPHPDELEGAVLR